MATSHYITGGGGLKLHVAEAGNPMDLRGHGLSDKPREGYIDSKPWADDVNAAIEGLKLDHPILSGWFYGPLVILARSEDPPASTTG